MTEGYLSYIPLYAVGISLLAVPFIFFSRGLPNVREAFTVAASVVKFGLVLSLLPDALTNRAAEITLVEISPGIGLTLRADPFGVYFAMIASGLWIFTSFYSIGYVRGAEERKQTRYFASFAICLSATIGIAFSANLITFLIFYEMLTVATYPLVIHKETRVAISAGRKYLVYTLTAGVVLIAAVAWTYQLVGNLDFVPGGLLDGVESPAGVLTILFVLFMIGVGVKAGIMPLHSWLPAAMAAPTPVSALLHAVAVVKSGVFGVMRVVGFVFGPGIMLSFGLNDLLMIFASVTIIMASLLAFREDNLKRRLAYSTVGHLSYIVLGAALLTPGSMTGGLLHIATHATMKITLFFCAGAIYVNVHKENISDLNGVGKAMPWTMAAFAVGSIGLAGIPPVNGFISKWLLGTGALEANDTFALGILLVSGLLNAGYFFPIVLRAFFGQSEQFERYGEASPLMVVPIVATAGLSLIFGIWPNFLFHLYDISSTIAHSVFIGLLP